jgi:hypothetical protein
LGSGGARYGPLNDHKTGQSRPAITVVLIERIIMLKKISAALLVASLFASPVLAAGMAKAPAAPVTKSVKYAKVHKASVHKMKKAHTAHKTKAVSKVASKAHASKTPTSKTHLAKLSKKVGKKHASAHAKGKLKVKQAAVVKSVAKRKV